MMLFSKRDAKPVTDEMQWHTEKIAPPQCGILFYLVRRMVLKLTAP